MATKKGTPGTAVAVNKGGKDNRNLPTNWEAQMEAAATEVASAEAAAIGGANFSVKGGILSYGGNPIQGNAMDCVVVDSIFENAFYSGVYDPNDSQPPSCYAYSRDGVDMAPHPEAPDKQADDCASCPNNQWGSGVKQDGSASRGKACKNTRRLAIMSATALESPDFIKRAETGMMKLPVTSTPAWANYVKSLAASYKRPPFGVITNIAVQPDMKNQVKVTFQAVDAIKAASIGQAILAKRESLEDRMFAPYPKPEEEAPKPQKRGGGGRQAAPAAKRKF